MLSTSGNLVVATLIWNLWRVPNLPAAAALSVTLAVVLGVCAGLSRSHLIGRAEAGGGKAASTDAGAARGRRSGFST